MFYGYRLNDQKEWTKMKTFDTIEEYLDYVKRRNIVWAQCSSKPLDLRGQAASDYDPDSDRLYS